MRKFITVLLVWMYASVSFSQTVSTLIGPDMGINDAILFDSQGNLFGSDHEGYDVFKYTPSGELITLATFAHHPNGMAIDSDDNIYVSTPPGNKIFRIEPDGTIEQYGPDVPNPNGIIFEFDSDTLIVTSYAFNTLSKLAPDGNLSVWIDDDQLDGPLGLTYDDNNVLYVSNFNDGKIFKVVGNDLEYFATIPGDYVGSSYFSTGYILWLDGFVYATGFAKNKIYRVDQEGTVEDFAGSGIPGLLDGGALNARFFYPNGITKSMYGDTLFISDYETHAVRIITDFTTAIDHDIRGVKENIEKCYPNPANTFLNFPVPENAEYAKIVDVYGRDIMEKQFTSTIKNEEYTFDTSLIPIGCYFLTIVTIDKIICHKIMIEH